MKLKLNTTSHWLAHLLLLCALVPNICLAQTEMSLDDIAQLKEDIIELNAEFKQLEKSHLYPDAVDTSLFLSVNAGHFFSIKSIEARINDSPVGGHFYTEDQRDALEKGGIHKIAQLHLKPGSHSLVITVIGEDAKGNTIKRGLAHEFTKTSQPLALELQILDNGKSLNAGFEIKEWTL